MRSLHHPWTLGLATGTTSRASFKKYVAQDAYFLRAFAKAYAYALIKAEDEEGVRAFHSLIGSVLEELSLHASYSLKWGVDLENVSEDNIPGRWIVAIASCRPARSNYGSTARVRSFRHQKPHCGCACLVLVQNIWPTPSFNIG